MKPSLYFALLACASVGLVRPASAADAPVLGPPPTDVVFFNHGWVDHVFTTGGALHLNNRYKVDAARRVAPGNVEIHTKDTDVFYIVDGSATFLTGGTAVDQKEIYPGEIRAKSITGGTERHLSKGDVIIIPQGTPHQFTEVSGPFLYFVVKVTQ
jgi:mannose-6-phosphate isomerase-like protein (cupin superfamily)